MEELVTPFHVTETDVEEEVDKFYDQPEDERHATFVDLSREAMLAVLYREIIGFRKDVKNMEEEARKMTSPEKVQEMMSGFMGGGLFT